jgi:hypothetical protein
MRPLRHHLTNHQALERLPRRLAGALLSVAVACTLLPSGSPSAAVAAPGGKMPVVSGADVALDANYFQREQIEQRDNSVKQDLRIPAGQREATFVTEPFRAPMSFSDVAPSWWADTPEGTYVQVDVRTGPDGRTWTDWAQTDLEDIDMPQDTVTRTYASLIPVVQKDRTHRYIQSRVHLRAERTGQTPVFRSLYYSFIDAGVTPNSPRPKVMIQGTPSDVPKPPMVSRNEWGSPHGAASPSWKPKFKRPTHIIIHHTATTNNDIDHPARVRAIWYYHAKTRGWGDVGYNYMIDPNGVIYEGRAGGDDVEAGHAYPFNVGSTGIGVLGSFMKTAPSAAAQAALIDLISWKVSQRGIDPLGTEPITGYTNCGGTVTYVRPTISGHRDYTGTACGKVFNKTTCPGDRFYEMLPQIRNAIVSEQPPLRAVFLKHDTPGNLDPRATLDVKLQIRNSGSQTWPATGQGAVSVGFRWFTRDGKPVDMAGKDERTPIGENVAFTEATSVVAKLVVPNNPGPYVIQWDMYRDGQGWFADEGSRTLRVDVVVGKAGTDKLAPKSSVLPLPSYSNSTELGVRWAGEDEAKGSGLVSFDIQYRIAPGGAWADWQSATSKTQGTFDAEDGYTYEFRSRARDAAGNLEAWPEKAQAYTTVDIRPPLLGLTAPQDGAYVNPGPLIVTGKTDPGTFVVVNETRAAEAGGVFTSTIHAEGRDFVIHITAADPAGNVSRVEAIVQAAPRFSDVPMSHPNFLAVEELSKRGIIIGYNDSTYRPTLGITRGQLAKMLVTAYGWTVIKPPEGRFADVPKEDWAYPYVETVVARGAMSGYHDGTFRAGAAVSRGALVQALVTGAGWKTNTPTRQIFTDVPNLHRYAPYLLAAKTRGIISADEDGAFKPDHAIDRASTAQWLYLTLKRVRDGGGAEPDPAAEIIDLQ